MSEHPDEKDETPHSDQHAAEIGAAKRPAMFGWTKGGMVVAEGVDLTEPACPEWPELIEEKMARMERALRDVLKDENGRI
jgi:hypothetical protein